MSDSHTAFDANGFSRSAGLAVFSGVSAAAGAILSERDRMQAHVDDAATGRALASWEQLVAELEHENVTLRHAVAERDDVNMLLEAENATLRQRLADSRRA